MLQYSYDKLGQRRTLTDPDDGVVTTTYDAAGQLVQLVNAHGEETGYAYDAAGQQILKQLDNGTRTSLSYDAAGRLNKVVNLDDMSVTISSYAYSFDGVGNRTSQVDHHGDFTNWTYDDQNQLGLDAYCLYSLGWNQFTPEQWEFFTADAWDAFGVDAGAAVYIFQYAYDPTGNRLTKADPDTGAITTSVYDPANRLLTAENDDGVTTYTYDANGNQRTLETPDNEITTNVWDYENRLIQVEHPDDSITTYIYNADGLKVGEDDGVDVKLYVYDRSNLLIASKLLRPTPTPRRVPGCR